MYAPIHALANWQSQSGWFTPDTVQRYPLGMKMDAMDPFWGYGEFVYGKAAAALNIGNVVVMQAALIGSFDKCPATALLGQPVLIAMSEMAISTFGWFMKAGVCPVKSSATVAAAANVALTSAGVIGASVAGKQICGYIQLVAQTGTKTFANAQTLTGDSRLITNGYDGLFPGAALSGTGIPASTVVAKLDPDGRTVWMGSAIGTIDKTATGTAAITATGTWTGFSLAHIESPFAQGAIT